MIKSKWQLVLSALALSVTPGLMAADFLQVSKYEWAPKEKATYYRGRFEVASGTYRFHSRNTHVTLPRSINLEVLAIDAESRSLGKVDVTETPRPDFQAPDLEKVAKPKDEVEAYLETIDALLEAEGAFRVKDGVEISGGKNETAPFNWSIGAAVGLGSEVIKANGSVANYTNQSIVGTTGLTLVWESDGGMKSADLDPWGAEFGLDFDNHQVRVVEDNTVDTSGQNTTEKMYRVRFHLSALYKIAGDSEDGSGWTVSFGLGGFRMPVFTVRDEASSRVQFSSTQPIGPRFGATYEGVLNSTQSWKGHFAVIPLAKDKDQLGRQFTVGGGWSYLLSNELRLTTTGDIFREDSRSSLSCKRAANCEEASSSSVQEIVFTVGALQQF